MGQETPSWAVVATVNEHPALVQAFVAWHLFLGASEVFVYFDRPGDPALDLIAHLPRVFVQSCHDPYWGQYRLGRPQRHQQRQLLNATHAYGRLKSDWLLHIDADEFVWTAGKVSAALSAVVSTADCAVVPVAERIYLPRKIGESVFEGAFRRPFRGPKADGPVLFGPSYALTLKGLTGHSNGKAFTRRERPLNISIHRPRPLLDRAEVATELVQGVELLHFDGLTPLHWVQKLLSKAHAVDQIGNATLSKHRQAQIDALREHPSAATDLHDLLKRPVGQTLAVLEEQALILQVPFARLIRELAAQPMLSTTDFDKWMMADRGGLLTRYGFVGAGDAPSD